MTARIFIHPRCVSGPAQGALISSLDAVGMDTENLLIGPENKRGHRELVRCVERHQGAAMYERMDGTRFMHREGTSAPAPSAA